VTRERKMVRVLSQVCSIIIKRNRIPHTDTAVILAMRWRGGGDRERGDY
jgi:hypothetical protein